MEEEKRRDKELHIQTSEIQHDFPESVHHHRYEPTPYALLDQLFARYSLADSDRIVDFGSGKGRLNFYLHHRFGAKTVGVEMNPHFHGQALENLMAYEKKWKTAGKIQFIQCLAQDYRIQPADNKFYFFNPFSVQIFISVLNNILESYEQKTREIDLILFFPSDDFIDYLVHWTPFELAEEMELPASGKDFRERFLVYRLSEY
ncbi:hypothetical protein BN1080_00478 [Planococcus massiliensis]|uniref:Uncharacterized protein n=1 Tax=Planococcus massiliensis TaxID=1499687 RepID=A0A098EKL4_9BACL|nr:methyltransferase [Planococcus massiliensis]CEG21566.1 hypothetical protein BN1080_00478 [Planococcus massiliensis]